MLKFQTFYMKNNLLRPLPTITTYPWLCRIFFTFQDVIHLTMKNVLDVWQGLRGSQCHNNLKQNKCVHLIRKSLIYSELLYRIKRYSLIFREIIITTFSVVIINTNIIINVTVIFYQPVGSGFSMLSPTEQIAKL